MVPHRIGTKLLGTLGVIKGNLVISVGRYVCMMSVSRDERPMS